MHEKRGKILGTILFILLISCILYLTFFPAKEINKGELKMIEISGNNLLSDNDYLTFTKLSELSYNREVTLPVIKDRFEKHPYISKADIESNGNQARIVISEKRIVALLLSGTDPYFISDDFQVLPMFSNTHYDDLPVISNVRNSERIQPLSVVENEDIKAAFRIIEAAKKANMNLFRRLSEINLRNGGDIILTFSGIRPPFIFGRSEEARKMIYLQILWDGILDGNSLIEESDYIDLRFANEVYIGKNDSI